MKAKTRPPQNRSSDDVINELLDDCYGKLTIAEQLVIDSIVAKIQIETKLPLILIRRSVAVHCLGIQIQNIKRQPRNFRDVKRLYEAGAVQDVEE